MHVQRQVSCLTWPGLLPSTCPPLLHCTWPSPCHTTSNPPPPATHHLALLGHLLYVSNDAFLLVLKPHSFPVKVTDGFIQIALVLPQQICGGP